MTRCIDKYRKRFNSHLLRFIKDKDNETAQCFLKKMYPFKMSIDGLGNTLLHHAASYGNEIITKFLIDAGCKVDAQNHDSKTAIMLAVEGGHERTIKALLRANASLDPLDSQGKNVLRIIADRTETMSVNIVKMILERVKRDSCCGDKVAQRLFEANCPLFYAVTMRDMEVTRSMLRLGSPIDVTATQYRLTALHGAVLLVDPTCVQLLVDHGADVNVKCIDGSAPLGCLHKFDDTENVQQVVNILLNGGTRWTDCDYDVPMQIHDICVSAGREIVRTLMEHNVDLYVRDSNGETLVHYLAENNNPGVIEELRGRNFNANATDDFGLTPLHMAVWCGNLEAIQFLIEYGADVQATANNGFTPLFYAFIDSHRSMYDPEEEFTNIPKTDRRIVEILLEHGAEVEVNDDNGTMTIFELSHFKSSPLAKPVLAHIAMQNVLGRPISEPVRKAIETHRSLRRHFELYRGRYEHMRTSKVYESVTLLDLLTTSDRQIMHYARNRQLVLNLAYMINDGSPDSHHYKLIQQRLADAVVKVAARRTAIAMFHRVTQRICSNATLAVDLIFNYLDDRDCLILTKLFQVKREKKCCN